MYEVNDSDSVLIDTEKKTSICTSNNTISLSDDEEASKWLHTRIDEIIYVILLPIVVVFSLAGNGAFLFTYENTGETRESWAMFYILYHSAEMKGRIPKLNAVSKTMEGLLALCNVTVGPIAAVYPQEGYRKKG